MNKAQWEALARAVDKAAVARGLTRKQLAMYAGCTGATIGNALNGKFNMCEERWRMVCEHLGIDYDRIVENAGRAESVPDNAEDTTNVDMEEELRATVAEMREQVEQQRQRAEAAEARVIQEVERRERLEEKVTEMKAAREAMDACRVQDKATIEELKCRVMELEMANGQLEEMEKAMQAERDLIRTEIWREAEAYVEQHRQETSRALLVLKARLYDMEHPELVG